MDLRDMKLFLHLSQSCHFGQTAEAMHVSPSTLSRQIQRLEAELGYALFVRDNRSVVLTEAGERFKVFAQQTLLHYQQLRQGIDRDNPALSGELRLFCSVTASYSYLPPILDKFRARQPNVEIKLTTGDPAEAVEMVRSGAADLAIAGRAENLPNSIAFTVLGSIPLIMVAPAMPCPVQDLVLNPADNEIAPDWHSVPFILPEQGPARRSMERWLRQHQITNPQIYATVAGHEAIVPMVALGCGIALLPDVVLSHSPEPIRNRITVLEKAYQGAALELGVCGQKKRLHEPLIKAFWAVL
jgi:LysR family transcriptional regulator, positive regulator for ilvC